MTGFASKLTLALATLNVATGIFIVQLLSVLGIQVANVPELRWTLTLGMPVVLFVAYIWAAREPADSKTMLSLQSIGLLTLSISPYGWILHHAQPS